MDNAILVVLMVALIGFLVLLFLFGQKKSSFIDIAQPTSGCQQYTSVHDVEGRQFRLYLEDCDGQTKVLRVEDLGQVIT